MSAYRGLQAGCEHAEAFHLLGGAPHAFDEMFPHVRIHGAWGGYDPLAPPGVRRFDRKPG